MKTYCRFCIFLFSNLVQCVVWSRVWVQTWAAGLAGGGVPMLLRENCKFSIKISAAL